MDGEGAVLHTGSRSSEVLHRHVEIRSLENALRSVYQERTADPVLLEGPSGTGKTCVANHVLNQLRRRGITTQYVNCWNYHKWPILYQLLEGINQAIDIHRQSTPIDVLLDRLRAFSDGPYVVVLDEVDQLRDKHALYDLYRIPSLSLVLVTNDREAILDDVDERVQSRLMSCVNIKFPRYTIEELVDILRDSVEEEMESGMLWETELSLVAQHSNRDARTAIGALQSVIRRAEAEHLDRLNEGMILEAVHTTKRQTKNPRLDRLTEDERLVYEIIQRKGVVAPKTVYAMYEQRTETPKSRRQIRNYLASLDQCGLIEARGSTRDRVYLIKNPRPVSELNDVEAVG